MTWYNTPERVQALWAEAASWEGVPFRLNGRTREGVGCAGLTHAIPFTLGALPDLELPRGSSRWGDQLRVARMSNFMREHPELFEPVGLREVLPGDIITGRSGEGEYHLGTWLSDWNGQAKSFIHAVPRYGVSFSNLMDPTYVKQLVAVWRIKHESTRP